MASWSMYFMLYGEFKNIIAGYRGIPRDEGLDSLDYLLSSGAAGVCTAVLSNPLWVIKTRMLSTGRSSPGAYSSMTNGLRIIIRDEGTRGLFRGLVPALFGVTHGALQFMFYERLKIWRKHAKENIDPPSTGSGGGAPVSGENTKKGLSNLDFLTLSATSKIMAGSITYPYRVVQTRMQTYDADAVYSSARDAVIKIWRNEGVGGFYKG
ncbi:mitochondrial carrier [Morchella conica CCBAS932]|uniref:Mitochondrial carrier n=2 Tax=Morchella sect. Distantes TaxID=1051054 RepID=A0A3N4L301_9PEZI|nr:mitochondrial carrier [Morchella conica CCBAS932]